MGRLHEPGGAHAGLVTAKLSIRATRSALAANDAARVMFAANQTNPIVMAIVKEFGLYPPGCYVALASGELGIVVRRGANANTPVVAALVNRKGEPMIDPIRRDTSQREHAIVGMASEKTVKVRVPTERLVMLG